MALVEVIRDDFRKSSVNAKKWDDWGGTYGNGEVAFTTTAASAYFGASFLNQTYDLAGSSSFVKVVTAIGTTYASAEQEFKFEKANGDAVFFNLHVEAGVLKLSAYKAVAGTPTSLATVTWNASTMAWWRLRESGGTTYWDYSADCITWTNLHSEANPITLTSGYCQLDAGQWAAEAGGQTVKFSNFNVPPTSMYPVELITSGSSTDATSYTTASTTATSGRLVLIWVYSISASSPNDATVTGSGLSGLTKIASQVDHNSLKKITLYKAFGTGSAGTIGIDFSGQTQTGCTWSVVEFVNATDVVQYDVQATASNATGLTSTLGTFTDSANITVGGFGYPLNNTNGNTGDYFIDVGERNQATPNMAIFTEWAPDNRTAVPVDISASSTAIVGISAELTSNTTTDITKSASYVVKSTANITKSAEYVVNSGGPIDITKTASYVVSRTTDITKTASYVVRFSTDITKSADYNVRFTTSLTKTAQYNLRKTTDLTKTAGYVVRVDTTITKSATYIAITNTQITKSAQYAVRTTLDITKSAQYNLRKTTDITKSTAYSVSRSTTATKSAQYQVPNTTTATKTAGYAIRQATDEVLDAEYLVATKTTLTNTAQYTTGIPSTITKSASYVPVVQTIVTKTAQYRVLDYPVINMPSGYEVKGNLLNKQYVYKVYSSTGAYLSTWDDVITDYQLAEEINTAGSVMEIDIPRKADDFGEGQDIDYANKVVVQVVDKEAANGLTVFTGYIAKYKSDYRSDTIHVTLNSYGADLGHIVMESAGNTTIAHNSKDPSQIIKDILDAYNGDIGYTAGTIDMTGTTVSYTFNTNTVKEGIDKCVQLAPAGWYYYVDQATNLLHFHELANTPDHVVEIGRNIEDLSIEKNIEPIINTLYFSGGGSPVLYKKYTNSTSITNYGVRAFRYKDARVTLTGTADIIANRILQGSPEILVEVTIIDSNLNDLGYDIESIKIGETIKIGSSGIGASSLYDVATFDTSPYDYDLTNLSSITFQVTSKTTVGDKLTLSLSTTPPDITKRISDIYRNLKGIENENNPTAPS